MMAPVAASLIAPVGSFFMHPMNSSVINVITGKGVRKAGKGQQSGILLLSVLSLIIRAMSGKGLRRARRGYYDMDYMD